MDTKQETVRISEAMQGALHEKQLFIAAYSAQHNVCPQCHAHPSIQTMVGFVFDHRNSQAYRDLNSVVCKCGWRGVVDDLVPKPPQ